MEWNGSRNHFHPDEVTFRKPDPSEETTSADRLPFAVNEDVVSEAMGGVLIRDGLCTEYGRQVITSDT